MFLFELQVDPFIWHLQPSETNQLLANNPDLSRKYDLYWYSGTAISALSMAIMLFELERHILKKKTKYGLSIFQVVTITLGLILGASSAEEVSFGKYMLYISSIPALFVPIIYLYYGFKTTGDSRKRAFKSAAGFMIFFLGSMVNSTLGKTISLNLFGEYGVIINYLLYGILSSVGIVIYHKSLVF